MKSAGLLERKTKIGTVRFVIGQLNGAEKGKENVRKINNTYIKVGFLFNSVPINLYICMYFWGEHICTLYYYALCISENSCKTFELDYFFFSLL